VGRGIEIEHVSRYADSVIVMGRDFVTNPPDAAVVERRFTNVWRFDGDGWRTIARHAHPVSADPQQR
jgi:hypothetical protein